MAKIQEEQFLHSDLMLYAEPELHNAEEQSQTEKLNKSNDLIFGDIELNIAHYSKKDSEIEVVSEVNEKPLSTVSSQTQPVNISTTSTRTWTYGIRRCGRLSEY